MKVILLEEVRGVGQPGKVAEVNDGYARNYLFPRKLAIEATAGALKNLQLHQAQITRKLAKRAADAQALADRLAQVTVTLKAKAGEGGKLYGSITAADITEELARAHGLTVDKRRVLIHEPIKSLGEHTVKAHLAPGIEPDLRVNVVEAEG